MEGHPLMSSSLPTERTAVVTGGASPRGIGRATADRLARDGWSVAILDIDEGAAKLAADVVGFSRALAREMGPHNITVNSVAPGPIDTEIMGGTLTDERKAQMSADIPLGRVGTVQDVAALLTFLMSEDAGYITAATYDVNGGLQIS